MRNRILSLMITIPFIALTGCEDSNSDSATESGKAIPDISASCSTTTSAECDTASDGDLFYMVWTTDTCDNFGGETINVFNTQPASCTTGNCASANVGVWLDNDTEMVATTIPVTATTAVVWMDLVDNGVNNDDGPNSGDVLCCLEDQAGAAVLDDSNCAEIPAP